MPPGRTQACARGHRAGTGDRVDHHVRALAAGVLHDGLLDLVVVARGDRQGGPEGGRGGQAVGVVAEADDPLGALGAGAVHAGEADGPVADHDDRLTGGGAGRGQPVPAGGHDVDQRAGRSSRGRRPRATRVSGAGSCRRAGRARTRTDRPARRHRAPTPGAPSRRATTCTHEDARPSRHQVHSPQATEHDDITRSPTARPVTPGPTASTVPMNSWPSREPGSNPKASPAL